jgi:hypothetical protein
VAAADDVAESENKARTLASGLGVIATQSAGIAKLPTALTPIATMAALESSGNPIIAGLITGALYGAWSLAGTQTISYGVSHYPRALQTIADNFPNASRRLYDSLPGFQKAEKREHRLWPVAIAHKLGTLAGRHISRGIASYTIGSAFMVTAGIKNQTKSERRRLSAKLSLDGAAVVSLMSIGIAEAVVAAGHNNPEQAQQLHNDFGNPLYSYGATALLMAAVFAINKLKNRNTSRR